jgi:hypothetical protein
VNVAALVMMPLALDIGERRFEQAKLIAAADVVQAAGAVRQAWIGAVAALKHHKVLEFPPEIVETLNKKLVDGYTYQEIAEWLKQMGHEVGKSSIGRYGKDFLSRLERLKLIKDQAKAIVETNPDAPTTEMAEAANQLAIQLITEALMQVDNLEGAKITEVFKALALLERSGVAREKLKYEYDRGVKAAIAKLKAELKRELGSNTDLLSQLEEMIESIQEQVVQR